MQTHAANVSAPGQIQENSLVDYLCIGFLPGGMPAQKQAGFPYQGDVKSNPTFVRAHTRTQVLTFSIFLKDVWRAQRTQSEN